MGEGGRTRRRWVDVEGAVLSFLRGSAFLLLLLVLLVLEGGRAKGEG